MSPHGLRKRSAKPCNRNAEESFPVLSLKSREQKPPNPLLIQDKNVLQPTVDLIASAPVLPCLTIIILASPLTGSPEQLHLPQVVCVTRIPQEGDVYAQAPCAAPRGPAAPHGDHPPRRRARGARRRAWWAWLWPWQAPLWPWRAWLHRAALRGVRLAVLGPIRGALCLPAGHDGPTRCISN